MEVIAYRLPIPQFFLTILIGLVCVDLKFDHHPSQVFTQHYYNGQMSYKFPLIEGILILTPIIMIWNALKYRNIWNYLSLIGLFASVAYFMIFALELELAITIEKPFDSFQKEYQGIKFAHLLTLALQIKSIICLTLGGRVKLGKIESKTQ